VIVHQVLSGAGPHDAVTRQALAIRERLTAWGWGGRDAADRIDPRIASRFEPLRRLEPARGDVLLVHWSAYAPRLRRVLDGPGRTLLLSHNVTPAEWFWDVAPGVAIHCALGRRQLPAFVAKADAVAGVSAFNARELGSDLVIPIVFDPPPGPPPPRGRDRELLFVGRLTPHKRQDELIRLVALLRRTGEPGLRLRLVGEPVTPAYLRLLEAHAEQLAPGAVTFESGLDDDALAERYRRAAALVCASEHEGFLIPLLEAFAHDLPVVARPHAAIPETAGDAALLVPDPDLGTFAEAVRLVLHEPALRDELAARGRARLRAFQPENALTRLRTALQALAAP
jgi:L-malate glycosyltransferase